MIATAINAPEDQVQADTELQNLEWWDSMGVLLLMAELDERFGIILEEETISSFAKVSDILKILIDADALLLLTDQQGLYEQDPRNNPDAELVRAADVNAPELDGMAGEGGALGRGGMVTKLRAARLAARSGTVTWIASGRDDNILLNIETDKQNQEFEK